MPNGMVMQCRSVYMCKRHFFTSSPSCCDGVDIKIYSHSMSTLQKPQCLFGLSCGNNIGYDDMRWHFPN